jgi:hypothetical protein
MTERKFKLYSDRARLPTKSGPSPLLIEYDYDIFKDESQNRRFIDALRKMTYVSLSVYHSNP